MVDTATPERPITFGPRADRPFSSSDSITKLTDALVKAQSVFKTIPKAKTAKTGTYSYTYADLAAVFDAIRAPLTDNGLTWMQPVSTRGTDVDVTTILAHTSGEWIASQTTIRSQDATAQKMGSAMTYAKRYALVSLVGVAADDEDDDGAEASTKSSRANEPGKKQDSKALDGKVTKPQIVRLRQALREHGVNEKAFGAYLKEAYGYATWKDIEQRRYDGLMALAEAGVIPAFIPEPATTE